VLRGDVKLASGNSEQRLAIDDEPGHAARRYTLTKSRSCVRRPSSITWVSGRGLGNPHTRPPAAEELGPSASPTSRRTARFVRRASAKSNKAHKSRLDCAHEPWWLRLLDAFNGRGVTMQASSSARSFSGAMAARTCESWFESAVPMWFETGSMMTSPTSPISSAFSWIRPICPGS
jgi:hypothetical protein